MPVRREANPQNRLACDRCHSQKLRCQRQDGQGICARCSRLRTACVFSPRQRRNTHSNHENCDVGMRPEPQDLSLELPVPLTTVRTEPSLADTQSKPHPLPETPRPDHVIDPYSSLHFAAAGLNDFNAGPDSGVSPSDRSTSLSSSKSPGLTDLSALLDMDFSNLGSTSASSNPSEWNFPMELATLWPPGAPLTVVDEEPKISAPVIASSLVSEEVVDMTLDASDRDAEVQMDPAMISPPTPTGEIRSGAVDIVHPVRRLADLNVRLYEHSAALPPVTMVASDKVPSLEGRLFAIDETFRMTQSLIDLLRTLYPRDGPVSDLVSDQGTLLLIMSCSNRVFDIYEVIFGHMRGCVNHNITPVTPDGKTVLLPELRIGSFAPPAPSAIAMQMLLIVMMASELFDQLRDVLGCWNSGDLSRRAAGGRFPDFAEDVGSELVKRAGSVAGEIGSARQMLLSVAGVPSLHVGALGGLGRALQPR
ncbi:hypothetical protein BN1723_002257 [Verticillium longisporum]|uniref:Zn(2)-C6 fungal-type domain-containing protein n=1 Tax=Verticillium longisporum TaxID=100787 RepID=A0A0G4L247_VERLO|nr:hypothetical protein BN1723_002257 [Verticillium longisporum]CRK42104.1 hypothetical protein BN1708_008654 [Verticillium longisporum]